MASRDVLEVGTEDVVDDTITGVTPIKLPLEGEGEIEGEVEVGGAFEVEIRLEVRKPVTGVIKTSVG